MSEPAPKTVLRHEARARRAGLAQSVPDFAKRLAVHAGALDIPPGGLIGVYSALPGEADPYLLLEELARQRVTFAFPRVAAKAAPLAYHLKPEGSPLQPGAYGIAEPQPDWPIALPQILLVPLLAFDARGHRLGYGGGFYDRTLAALGPGIRTIGIAYAGQEVEHIPHEPHDHPLDLIATEQGVRRFHHT
jgi:5-formyltetrahydrofolate cyclo-ligase